MASTAKTTDKNLTAAESYYDAMKHKDADGMARYLHNDVHVITPMGELAGKEKVLDAAKKTARPIKDIQIKSHFTSDEKVNWSHEMAIDEPDVMKAEVTPGDQVMLTYDMDCAQPIGTVRAAALMTFKDGLIIRNELFFDARPFEDARR